MNKPSTAREALIMEALGETGQLVQRVEHLVPLVADACEALRAADLKLQQSLSNFESRITAITDNATHQAAHHLARRVDDAARLAIEQQGRAMATAARIALGTEIGSTLQRLQSGLQHLRELRQSRWETVLTHLAVAAAAWAATWLATFQRCGH